MEVTNLSFVLPILLLLLPSSTTTPTQQLATSEQSKVQVSQRPIFLVVSFDGFRHSYLNPSRTPILSNLASTGVTVPYMIPAFPTKTFPNHQSIATGLYTESHGIIDNILYDPLYSTTLDGKKNDPGFWNYDEHVLPLWIRNELTGGISGGMMWPGSSQGYGDRNELLPTYYYNGYNESMPWEMRVDTVISWMTDKDKPANLVFLYYHQPDSAGHKFGPNGEETLEQVKETDKRVDYLLNKLREVEINDKVNLVLLSDHGMEEVTSDRNIYLKELLDRENLVRDVNGGSPVIQVVPKSGLSDQVYEILERESRTGNFTVFRKVEMCEEPYFYCKSRRIHDFVTLADPGWAIRDTNRKKPVRNVYGSHGYINTAESMHAFFIAKGPAFKQGFKTEQPIKNVDIVPLISKALGIMNVPTNGSLSRVEGMLGGF